MKKILTFLILFLVALPAAPRAHADDNLVPDRILGKPDAPVTVEEYVSLTCSHCAAFYNETLPDLEKNYVDTGKVRFILRDFPLDNIALKAAAVARCMPADEFYPFVKVLYKNQAAWVTVKDPEAVLIQYAKLGGLDGDKAKACIDDTKLQDAIVDERKTASEKVGVEATPTFMINGEKLQGAQPAATFAQTFDRLLAAKH